MIDVRGVAERVSLEGRAVRVLAKAGMFGLDSPAALKAVVGATKAYGPFAGAPAVAAVKHADRCAIVDDSGTLTFRELEDDVNRLARAFADRGVTAESTVGILCRNGRAPLLASFAAGRLGAKTVWLNTGFSPRQACEVTEREGVQLVVADDELAPLLDDAPVGDAVIRTACEQGDELLAMIAGGNPEPVAAPAKAGKIVILTSGTTGLPKGAARSEPRTLVVPGALLERFPLRSGEATIAAPPLLHGTGLFFALISIGLGSTTILRRRFDPEQTLADIEEHRATAMIAVPVMLQRIVALGEEKIRSHDLSSLRAVLVGGSRLPAGLSHRSMDLLGEVLHNFYGSTEAGMAAMATPRDLRDAPDTCGRPLLGTTIRILDDAGRKVSAPQSGRIFIRMATVPAFDGYTGGGGKEVVDGFTSAGDLGHFDDQGRLYIDGRDDEMIVSGGENVFPREVEDLLAEHAGVEEVAAVGVDDEEFGQRLEAFVVLSEGASLTEDGVKQHVRDNLARYKVPRRVVFLDELPRNAMGKVLKGELAESAANTG